MTVTSEQLREGQVYSFGQDLVWSKQSGTDGPPGLSGEGVKVGTKTIVSNYVVQCREDIAFKTVRFTASNFVVGDTIDVTIGSVTDTYTIGSGTDEEEREDLVEFINLEFSDASASITDDNEIEITGDDSDSYAFGVSGGAGSDIELEVTHEDADSCDFRIYLRPPTSGAGGDRPSWSLVNDGSGSVEFRGLTDRLVTAGYDQIYIEVYNKDQPHKDVTVFIGRSTL